jgi:tetratricopeptide (TPR) repeat protein
VLILVGAGFYIFMYQPDLVRRALGRFVEEPDDGRGQAFFIKGRESFLLDTEAAFVQADREYHKVLALDERHAPTLAALAEMYAVWAQYLRDQGCDSRVDAAAAQGSSPHLREITRLKSEFESKIADADRWGTQAVAAQPAMPAAHLAMADVSRLKGDLRAAEEHLSKAQAKETADAAAYVAAMVALEKGAPPTEALASIRRIGHTEAEPMLRAQYREARILAATGKAAEAKEVLAKLLEMNSDHEMARDLAARIDGGHFVALSERDAAAEEKRIAEAAVPEVVTPPTTPEVQEPVAQPVAAAGGGGAGAGGAGAAGGGGQVGIDDLDAMLAKASKLQESGQTAEARRLFETVLEQRPNDIDALSGLAYCYLDQGAKGQAIATFRRALGVNPSYGPALIGLAETYKAQGNKEQALKWYKEYRAKHPSSQYSSAAERNAAQIEADLAAAGGAAAGGGAGTGDTGGATTGGTEPTPPSGGEAAPAPEPAPPTPPPGG